MSRRLRSLLCVAIWCALSSAAVAHAAQPSAEDLAAAKELFRAGRAAYERGDFRAAAASFEEAARLAPHPDAWHAAGDAWDAARDATRAVYALERSLELPGLSPRKATIARRRLARLTPRLGLLQIDGPAEAAVAVAHLRREPLPALIHVPPGSHEVRLVEPASAAQSKTVAVQAGQRSVVRFELPEPEDDAAPPPPPPPPPAEPESDAMAIAGWAVLGIGVGGAIAAAVVTSQALDAKDEWEADLRDLSLRDRAESLRTGTAVAWVAAGAVLATGVTLLVVDATGAEERSDETVAKAEAVSVQLGPASLCVLGRF